MMKVVFNRGQILVFEIQECTGAKLDRLICNMDDSLHGLKILKSLQEKYGFLEGIRFVNKDGKLIDKPVEKTKTFLDY